MINSSDSSSEMTFRVLTLNCWCIGYAPAALGGSPDLSSRAAAIADFLRSEEGARFDAVCLQELWTRREREAVAEACRETLPHSRQFHGGVVGTGLLILSRFPIVDSSFRRFSVNGFLPAVWLGDGAAAKGVAMAAVVAPNGLRINVYTSHYHAEYDRSNDWYLADRTAQALEGAEWIGLTSSRSCDVVVYAGDLNFERGSLPWRILTDLGGLCEGNSGLQVVSYGHPDNSYTKKTSGAARPAQIDHILHRPARKRRRGGRVAWSTRTELLWSPLPSRVPGRSFSYSDHEGVGAEILITPRLQRGNGEEEEEIELLREGEEAREERRRRKKVLEETIRVLRTETNFARRVQIGTTAALAALSAIGGGAGWWPDLGAASGLALGAALAVLASVLGILLQERRNAFEELVERIGHKLKVMRSDEEDDENA